MTPDGTLYQGYWQNDLKHGQGMIIFNNGDIYEGSMEQDMRKGIGVQIYGKNGKNGKYQGQWDFDARHG